MSKTFQYLKNFVRNKRNAPWAQDGDTDKDGLGHPRCVTSLMRDSCNSRCVMCGVGYADNPNVSAITYETYMRMLGHLEMKEVKQIVFSGGGEPLLCEDLLRIVRETKRGYPWVMLVLYTNGIVLSEEMARQLLDQRVNKIIISINASRAETHRRVTGTDAFAAVVRNVKGLVRARDRAGARPHIELSFAASLLNIDDLCGIIRAAGPGELIPWTCSIAGFIHGRSVFAPEQSIPPSKEDILCFTIKIGRIRFLEKRYGWPGCPESGSDIRPCSANPTARAIRAINPGRHSW